MPRIRHKFIKISIVLMAVLVITLLRQQLLKLNQKNAPRIMEVIRNPHHLDSDLKQMDVDPLMYVTENDADAPDVEKKINQRNERNEDTELHTAIKSEDNGDSFVNFNVHAFYYTWYGNPGQDGRYIHWNHAYLPHWNAKVSAQFPTGKKHVPPQDIGASFYPLLGPYSSFDESITRAHMLLMQQAGIGVLALSWYPPGLADDNGQPAESYVPTVFDIADEFNIKVCFHVEPYKNRDAASMKDNITYILKQYGDHPAFYRYRSPRSNKELPLIYVYDSYLVKVNEWQRLLSKTGDLTIRDTDLDCVMIALLVKENDLHEIADAGFDGLYTYFAADGFSYGSSKHNWNNIAKFTQRNNLIFIPSVGPGYDDTRVRPWNTASSRDRMDGQYYEKSWEAAVSSHGVKIISITSFNEWHEGTQIEPASSDPKQGSFPYLTYGSRGPYYYIELTKKWSQTLNNKSKT